MNHSKVYLPNLNTVRAIAALMVIMSHIEAKMGYFNLIPNSFISSLGGVGVTLFFSLSGFLITYLLLKEKEVFSKINIKDFYVRRTLRIWPLYFLVLIFIYVVIPYLLPDYYISEQERFTSKSFLLNVFFLTNLTIALKYTPLIISVIWSIGIEEQFYLFWPWVVKSKKILYLMLSIIFIIPLIKLLLLLLIPDISELKIIYKIMSFTRFDSMAIGGFFGLLSFRKKISFFNFKIKQDYFKTRNLQILIYGITIIMYIILMNKPRLFNFYNYQILPVLFSIIILNLIDYKQSIFKLENRVTNYLGKISYSLYLLHLIVLYFLFPILKPLLHESNTYLTLIVIYSTSILFSIFFSIMSYELIEKRFLKIKKRFSHIKT